MSKYISFVFHQKSANQVVQPVKNDDPEEDEDEDYEDSSDKNSESSYGYD